MRLRARKLAQGMAFTLVFALTASQMSGCGDDGSVAPDPQVPVDPDPQVPLDPVDPVTPQEPSEDEKRAAAPALWRALNGVPASPLQPDVYTSDGYRIMAVIDARAGGTANANATSWSYIDVHAGETLPISDVESFANDAWDIAVRRSAFRINSGHSGPGSVEIAKLENAYFDQVHAVEGDLDWATDTLTWVLQEVVDPDTDEVTSAWTLLREPFGYPWAAVNTVNRNHEPSQSWYSYGGPGGLDSVYSDVYLLRDGSGKTFKFQIRAYDDAIWTLRWEELFGACDASVAGLDDDGAGVNARRLVPYDYVNDPSGPYNEATLHGDVTTIHVGVGAGGSGSSSQYAFNYFDLEGRFPTVVDSGSAVVRQINDVEAKSSLDWVLGVRRQVMVVNGGDYGVGGWEVARAVDTNFEALMELPSGLKWETELTRYKWEDNDGPECVPYGGFYGGMHRAMDELNYDRTPMATWYKFKAGTFADAEPYANVVYLLRNNGLKKAYAVSFDAILYRPLADGQTGSGTRNTSMTLRAKPIPWPR